MARTKKTLSVLTDIDRPNDVTLGQHAYDCIRTDILKGNFKPGSPLRLQALKERYGLSFSPLREALNRLQSEQLVESFASRGFRVTDISLEEMWDAFETRILIDCEGLRRSIRRGNDDWEALVLGTYHALSRAFDRSLALTRDATETERVELEDRHAAFHHALISSSGSNWMLRFSTQLYHQTQRYRWPFFTASADNVFLKQSYILQHKEIADYAVAREEEKAVELFARSLRRTGEVIEEMTRDAEAKRSA